MPLSTCCAVVWQAKSEVGFAAYALPGSAPRSVLNSQKPQHAAFKSEQPPSFNPARAFQSPPAMQPLPPPSRTTAAHGEPASAPSAAPPMRPTQPPQEGFACQQPLNFSTAQAMQPASAASAGTPMAQKQPTQPTQPAQQGLLLPQQASCSLRQPSSFNPAHAAQPEGAASAAHPMQPTRLTQPVQPATFAPQQAGTWDQPPDYSLPMHAAAVVQPAQPSAFAASQADFTAKEAPACTSERVSTVAAVSPRATSSIAACIQMSNVSDAMRLVCWEQPRPSPSEPETQRPEPASSAARAGKDGRGSQTATWYLFSFMNIGNNQLSILSEPYT